MATWIRRLVLVGVIGLAGQTVLGQSNLCSNSKFDHGERGLEGWNVNYEWSGNEVYTFNPKSFSVLPDFRGRTGVLHYTPIPNPGHSTEGKVETCIIKYEPGARYQCTLDLIGGVRVYFNGYMWRPGLAPNENPELKDLRRIFKGDPFIGAPQSWKTVTVAFPHAEVSELAAQHLKKVRFFTVQVLMPAPAESAYISNVKIVKLPMPYKVSKTVKKTASESGTGLGDKD